MSEELDLCVVLDERAQTLLEAESRRSNRLETGGILIGKYENERVARVLEATPAPPDSKRTPWSFHRGIIGLNGLLSRCWKQTGRYYLGEWHYHPYAAPTPSSTDTASIRAISRRTESQCDTPILIILGGKPDNPVYRVHLMRQGRLHRLASLDEADDGRRARWWHPD